MSLGIREWRLVGLLVELGGFMDQGVEIGRLGIRGWRLVGLVVELGGFVDQGVEIGRFRGGDGWV